MNNQRIWLSLAKMTGNEQQFIQEAFDTNWVVPLGPNVDEFERGLADFLGTDHVVALSSGTAALHLALVMLGIQPGDEVLCQSFTFAASVNPVTYLGATPILVDSDPETWNMDPGLLEEAIQARLKKRGVLPKAIIPVHLYGMPAQLDDILAISNKYNIPVIEDACEAFGSTYRGQTCGTWGRFGALSFNGNKMITTSGGGALICPSAEAANRVKFFATQARDANPFNEYRHTHIGYNYRLSNICAGIGRGQLTAAGDFIARRREIHNLYSQALSSVQGLRVQEAPSSEFASNFWLTTILIDPVSYGIDRNELAGRLNDANIESRPLWKPMHLQPVYANSPRFVNGVSESLFAQGLCLPSGPTLSNDDIQRVIDVIRS